MITNLENRAFVLLLILVTIGFLWLLTPFYSAVFWASILAILFAPLEQGLRRRLNGRATPSALLTVLITLLLVIIPLILALVLLGAEIVNTYQRITGGEFSIQPYLDGLQRTFPFMERWIRYWAANWTTIKDSLSAAAVDSGQFVASQVVQFGQGYLQFVINIVLMLYLTFFFLRDGDALIKLLIRALPLGDSRERLMFQKFAEVCRATVKGSLVVALIQGAVGGVTFGLLGIEGAALWGALMVILSLLPAIGTALIWGPVAVWLMLTGDYVRAVILILVGIFLIGLIDNVLRPILVGRSTKMPDYLILISTLGGISLFGLNGFVIGPVLAALFLVIWQIFMAENQPNI